MIGDLDTLCRQSQAMAITNSDPILQLIAEYRKTMTLGIQVKVDLQRLCKLLINLIKTVKWRISNSNSLAFHNSWQSINWKFRTWKAKAIGYKYSKLSFQGWYVYNSRNKKSFSLILFILNIQYINSKIQYLFFYK